MESVEYRVGRFTLHPRRQLLEGEAPVSIGRKALDLLSALAEADGALVTKDELMAAVWPNATVEENAIQVHIVALRKALGDDAELLSTVRGLGYRLRVVPPTAAEAPAAAPIDRTLNEARTARRTRRWASAVVAGALLALVVAFVGMLVSGSQRAADKVRVSTVVVAPFEGHGTGSGVREVAEGMGEAIAGALSSAHLQVTPAAQARQIPATVPIPREGQAEADLRVAGAVSESGSTYEVHVRLDDVRQNVVLWSDTFEGASAAPAALEASVAAHLADAALWAGVGRSGRVRLGPSALAAFIAGREATIGVRGDAAALSDYRRVVAEAPDFSWGHSAIAVTHGFELASQPPPLDAPILRTEARREAQRALALDPHNGEAFLGLELAAPPLDWRGREDWLVRGAAAEPGFEPVAMMEGRLLWMVGRDREATEWLELAHDLDPLHNGATWSLAVNLASRGQTARSRALLAKMLLQWPDHGATKEARFWASFVSGATEDTIRLLTDTATWPSEMDRSAAAAWTQALQATAHGDPTARARAVATVVGAAQSGSVDHGEAMLLLSLLGDLDASFAQAQLYVPDSLYAPPYLSLPQAAAMRADRRFMPLARKLGLVAYWRSSGHWPDFCRDPGLPYDCRAEAAKP